MDGSGKSLEELKVWVRAREFRNDMSTLTKTFPVEEKYRLKDQLIRASRSISANIPEGQGRFHYQENSQFCRMARGSLVECFDHLTCALDELYITKEQFKKYENTCTELHKMLNGYISYLQKRKTELK